MDTITITLAPLADAMTAADLFAHAERLRKMIGGKAEIYPAISGSEALVSIYPTGLLGSHNDPHMRAPTWPEAFAAAEAWITARAAVRRDTTIRRMALAIVDITDQHTRCTMADLTRREFTDAEVREFHEAACARAGEMAGAAPFCVEGVMSAHTLPTPLRINMDASFIERTIEVDTDDCGQVWMHDITADEDEGCRTLTTCFPTLDDAERVALRILAAVRAGRVGV